MKYFIHISFWVWISFLFQIGSVYAKNPSVLVLRDSQNQYTITDFIEVLESPEAIQDIHQLLRFKDQLSFRPVSSFTTQSLSKSRNSEMPQPPGRKTNWLSIHIENRQAFPDTLLMYPFSLKTVANYGQAFICKNGEVVQQQRFGKLEPMSSLDNSWVPPPARNLRRMLFPFVIQANEELDIYIHYQHDTRFGSTLDCDAWLIPARHSGELLFFFQKHYRYRAFYQGILWIFICFSLLNFLYRRDKAYLFYALYIICLSLTMSYDIYENTLQLFVMPDYPLLAYHLFTLGNGGMMAFYILFVLSFLQINTIFPLWVKRIRMLVIACFTLMVVYQCLVLLPFHILPFRSWSVSINSIYLTCILILQSTVYCFVLYLIRWKDKRILFIISGTSLLGLAGILHTLSILGIQLLPPNIDTYLVLQFCSVMELMIFSLGLARRDQIIAQEKLRIEELEQLKTRFFTNISHEFRTLLTLIKAPLHDNIQALAEGNEKAALQLVYRNADRLHQLVDQLLDLAKFEAGKFQSKPQTVNLTQLIRQIAASFQSLADQKQIDFRIQIPTADTLVHIDSDLIEKIMANLLSNAFKFAPDQGWVECRAIISKQPFLLQLTIGNDGVPIPEAELSQIFDQFYQSENRIHQGSGIGLALVKELVDFLAGRIEVQSARARGTFFELHIPLKKAIGPLQEIPVSAPSASIHYQKEAPTTIHPTNQQELPVLLIVEDHEDVRNYLQQRLLPYFQLIIATHGRDGFEKAIKHLPDMIISDVMMPYMDGVELCHLLKHDNRTDHIPVILLTAKTDVESRITGLQTGADDYLAKPFNSQELLVRVQNLLDQRKRLQARFSQQIVKVNAKEITVDSAAQRFLSQAIETVEEKLSDADFSVQQFADAMSLSRTQLHRKLKSLTAHSATDFIRNLRLQRAEQLIRQEADSMSQIAYSCGFNNLSYFAKCFKEKYACNPSEYAKKQA